MTGMNSLFLEENVPEKLVFQSCYIKPNLDCNHTFSIDLLSNGIPFGDKSIEKFNYNLNLVLLYIFRDQFICAVQWENVCLLINSSNYLIY